MKKLTIITHFISFLLGAFITYFIMLAVNDTTSTTSSIDTVSQIYTATADISEDTFEVTVDTTKVDLVETTFDSKKSNTNKNKILGDLQYEPKSVMEFVDSLVNGSLTVWVNRIEGKPCKLEFKGNGNYLIKADKQSFIQGITLKGNNANLNPSQELVIKIDTGSKNKPKRFVVQIYDAANNSLVGQQATGTVHTQTVSNGITTILIPNLNGFGTSGYYIELR